MLADALANVSEIRRRVHFDGTCDENAGGRRLSTADVMDALLGLRARYDERTTVAEGAWGALSQRVGFDEAMARAAERSLGELRTTLGCLLADVSCGFSTAREQEAALRHEMDSMKAASVRRARRWTAPSQ